MNESESAKAKEKWIPDIRRIVPIFIFYFFLLFVVLLWLAFGIGGRGPAKRACD